MSESASYAAGNSCLDHISSSGVWVGSLVVVSTAGTGMETSNGAGPSTTAHGGAWSVADAQRSPSDIETVAVVPSACSTTDTDTAVQHPDRHGLRESASAFACCLPGRLTMSYSNSSRKPIHRACCPIGSGTFSSHCSAAWSVLTVNLLPRR